MDILCSDILPPPVKDSESEVTMSPDLFTSEFNNKKSGRHWNKISLDYILNSVEGDTSQILSKYSEYL
jgi:hypothetical protein